MSVAVSFILRMGRQNLGRFVKVEKTLVSDVRALCLEDDEDEED